jgi:hypothetical protein
MCGNYDQLWLTTSLRGAMHGVLDVSILSQGVHSGDASGIVPDTFRIARQLLDRVENSATGVVQVPELWQDVPPGRRAETAEAVEAIGDGVVTAFPFLPGATPVAAPSLVELQLNRTWRPQVRRHDNPHRSLCGPQCGRCG